MSTGEWWAGLAPVTVELDCGSQLHEVHWVDGVLSTPAHPDAERERALMALGADPTPCMAVLDGWLRHSTDLDVLLLAPRGPGDTLAGDRPQQGRRGNVRGWVMYAPMSSAGRSGEDDSKDGVYSVERLLGLDGGLPDRLTATVVAHWAQRLDAGDAAAQGVLPRLEAALYGRLRYAIHAWRGTSRHVEVEMTAPGIPAAIERSGQLLRIKVPFSWLRDVWARGIATTFGRFCLAAEHDGDEWSLTVVDLVDRDLGRHRVMTISLS